MNIKGIQFLEKQGFPLMKDTLIFKFLSDVPESYQEKYRGHKRLHLQACDDRCSITDYSYTLNKHHVRGFPTEKLKKKFTFVNRKMDKFGVPNKNRIYLSCRSTFDHDLLCSGRAVVLNNAIHVDLEHKNMLGHKKEKLTSSYEVPVVNNKPFTAHIEEHKDYIRKVAYDVLSLHRPVYVNFSVLKDGYLYYNDLSFSK